MITGKTAAGFEYEIDAAVMDDFEVLELVGKVDESVIALPKLLTMIFGEDQRAAYYEHMRDRDSGRISTSKVLEDIEGLFATLNSEPETKN